MHTLQFFQHLYKLESKKVSDKKMKWKKQGIKSIEKKPKKTNKAKTTNKKKTNPKPKKNKKRRADDPSDIVINM